MRIAFFLVSSPLFSKELKWLGWCLLTLSLMSSSLFMSPLVWSERPGNDVWSLFGFSIGNIPF